MTVVLLLVLLLGLCVHYGWYEDRHWPYPDDDDVLEDPDRYDGERVLIIGQVESVERGADRLVMISDDTLEIEVVGIDVDVEPGGTVQVYGPLADGATRQTAESVVVVNGDRTDRWYKNGMSALAGFLTAGLFLYYWRVHWQSLSFRRRHA